MKIHLLVLLLALPLAGCGDSEVEVGAPPDVFRFDSGGADHIEGYGAWRVTASRDGRLAAVHDVRGQETSYDEVVLDPPERALLWAAIDAADLAALPSATRPGVPDEVQLTFRLERGTGETIDVEVWQNDARGYATLVALLQELKIRLAEAYGVEPVF